MIVNGVDVREYGAKLLTVEEQPPKISVKKEMIQRALLPTEYETDIPLGTLKLTIYFRARNRAELQRTVSRFMMQFRQSAVLEEIKGYKGKYKAYLTDDSLTKTLDLSKKILELSIDGYFFDDDMEITFDGKTSGQIFVESSKDAPCIIAITAKQQLTDYTITLNGEVYTVETLAAGKTLIIDGRSGTATIDGKNAFDQVSFWQFPRLAAGENDLTFSSGSAKVMLTYTPMWM